MGSRSCWINGIVVGDALASLHEESITSAGYVAASLHRAYVEKADARAGGVGYESSILSAQLLTAQQIAAKNPPPSFPLCVINNQRAPAAFRRRAATTSISPRCRGFRGGVRTACQDAPRHTQIPTPALGANPFGATARPARGEPSRTIKPRPAEPFVEGSVESADRGSRRRASGAAARQSKFPQLAHSTAEGRADEPACLTDT